MNSQVSPFDSAVPGALPVLSRNAVLEPAVRAALLLNCTINEISTFDRKHYFYRDLPASYQITQYFKPFAHSGKIHSGDCEVIIDRIQLEQDSAKTWHAPTNEEDAPRIDLNRAGMALIEIVTAPCFSSGRQVKAFLDLLQKDLVHAKIMRNSDGDECFRFDVNVSLHEESVDHPRCEIKNMTALKLVDKAIEAEIKRQEDILKTCGGKIERQTLSFNAETLSTHVVRNKVHLTDYRFLPDANLKPLCISPFEIEAIKEGMPEPLYVMRRRLASDCSLNEDETEQVISYTLAIEPDLPVVFQDLAQIFDPRLVKTLLLKYVLPMQRDQNLSVSLFGQHQDGNLNLNHIKRILEHLSSGRLTIKNANRLLISMCKDSTKLTSTTDSLDSIATHLDLLSSSSESSSNNNELLSLISQIVRDMESKDNIITKQYVKRGKTGIIDALMRKVIRATGGKLNPQKLRSLIQAELETYK